MNYKQKYEDALNRAKSYKGLIAEMGIVFPELKESEDKRMRKNMREFLLDAPSQDIVNHHLDLEETLAWLEKQGEKVNVIENFNTEFEKQVSHLIASIINKEHEYNEGFVKWAANALLNYAKHELEKQGEQKSDDKINTIVFRDFNSVFSKEQVEEIDKRIEKAQKLYNTKLRDTMRKVEDFQMTD